MLNEGNHVRKEVERFSRGEVRQGVLGDVWNDRVAVEVNETELNGYGWIIRDGLIGGGFRNKRDRFGVDEEGEDDDVFVPFNLEFLAGETNLIAFLTMGKGVLDDVGS